MDDNLLVLFMALVILTMGFSYMYKNKPGTTSYDAVIKDLKNKMEVLNGAIKITDKRVNIGKYDTPYQFSVGKMWGINSVNDDTGGSHTTIYRNTKYDSTKIRVNGVDVDKGFVNANPGSCSQISMGGGSAGVGFIRLYAGSTAPAIPATTTAPAIPATPAGTPAGLNGIFINSSGNVGIGTESPDYPVHIVRSITTCGTPIKNPVEAQICLSSPFVRDSTLSDNDNNLRIDGKANGRLYIGTSYKAGCSQGIIQTSDNYIHTPGGPLLDDYSRSLLLNPNGGAVVINNTCALTSNASGDLFVNGHKVVVL